MGATLLWLFLLLSLASLLAVPAQAEVLVSNTGQDDGSTGSLAAFDHAQAFTTGSHSTGYHLTSVGVDFGNLGWTTNAYTVSIKTSSDGLPGTVVGSVLAGPATLVANSVNTFTAGGSGILLDANTTYFVVVESTENRANWIQNTESDSEDADMLAGWSIADTSLYKQRTSLGTWTSFGEVKKISLGGREAGAGACTVIWCATLTVQDLGTGHRGCANDVSGSACSDTSHLSEDAFTHDATGYTVTGVRRQSNGQLQVWFDPDLTAASQSLALHIGTDVFYFEDADVKNANNRHWNNAGLGWSTGDTVNLELREDTRALATGKPGISGTPWVGQTLSAMRGTINDGDGLPAIFPDGYSFQWYRVDADGTTNRTAIPGATGATYTLADAEEGKKVIVEVSFTDGGNYAEGPLESAAWPAYSDTVTAPPVDGAVLLDTTLTVASAGKALGCSSPNSSNPCTELMAEDSFTSTDSGGGGVKTFTIDGLQVSRIDTPNLHVQGVPYYNVYIWFAGVRELRDYEVNNLVLELDGQAFPFRKADHGGYHLRLWQHVALRWSAGDTVAVRILDNRTSLATILVPLTMELDGAPQSHDGTNPFTFRLAFSEAVDIEADAMRDHALLVSGGSITAATKVDERSDLWELTLTPTGALDVEILVPLGRTCNDPGALCTADGRMLSGAVPAVQIQYLASPQLAQGGGLTAAFENLPVEHDGTNPFTLELAFSEAVFDGTESVNKDQVIREAISVTGGTLSEGRRVQPDAFDRWVLRIRPSGHGAVTVTLPATTGGCGTSGAICTPGGVPLDASAMATVQGPPGLSVADAEVHEGAGALLAFAVTLSRASASTVAVDYATADDTAEAGLDYTAASGTLTFVPGETEKMVNVTVLDDDHDEDSETMTLTLSNPSGGNAYLADASATGTINNTNAMPKAWLARFGRTVAEQVIEALESRLSGVRTPGGQLQVAGRHLDAETFKVSEERIEEFEAQKQDEAAREPLESVMAWLEGHDQNLEQEPEETTSHMLTSRDLLAGTSFSLTEESSTGALVSVWGQGAISRFDGRDDALSLDGEVETLMLGADWSRHAWTTGVLFSHSRGDGDYRGQGAGRVESTLSGVWPYTRYQYSERLSVWGIAGYGEGELDLKPDGATALETDMDLVMGAVGIRGIVRQAPERGGLELAVTSDALTVRTATDRTAGLASSEADVTRLRLGLEGTWHGLEAGAGTWVPGIEVGIRHDGGDAETGFGADVGTRLAFTHEAYGITAELKARGLLTHEASGFENTGISGSLAWNPRPASHHGPSLTLIQTMGASTSGGMEALLGRATLAGLHNEDRDSTEGNRQLELVAGYGFGLHEGRLILTPELGLARSPSRHEYRFGTRLELAAPGLGSMELDFRVRRQESVDDLSDPEHAIGLQLQVRF